VGLHSSMYLVSYTYIYTYIHTYTHTHTHTHGRVYPKDSGLASWSENCKWYTSLPLVAVVSLFCESF
jgi:hypothetical protein